MLEFDKRVKAGTRVIIENFDGWYTVKSLENNRKLIKVNGLGGHFQRGHVLKFTNSKSLTN